MKARRLARELTAFRVSGNVVWQPAFCPGYDRAGPYSVGTNTYEGMQLRAQRFSKES